MTRPVSKRPLSLLFLKIGLVAALAFVSSYCTQKGKKTENVGLSPDESCLVDAYVRIAAARDLRAVTYEESESLFAVLGSTVDTSRISRAIQTLNADPERWIFIFQSIDQAMGSNVEVNRPSEQHR